MSFSKAKIHRFNDVKATTTVPGKTTLDKPKSKSKTCDKSSDVAKSETASSQSVPCFRTPTLLRKKVKTPVPITQTKPTELFTTNQNLEILKEKIVECENKDAYIKDLTQQLEEFKEKISQIESSKIDIDIEKEKYEQTIENLKNEQELELKYLKEEFLLRLRDTIIIKDRLSEQLSVLKNDYLYFKDFCAEKINELKLQFNEIPNCFLKYSQTYQILINQKEAELKNTENILKNLKENMIEMQKQHSLEVEKLRKEQQLEMQDLEFEMLKTMTELLKEKEMSSIRIKDIEDEMNLKMTEMMKTFEADKEVIVYNSEMKIKELEAELQNSNLTFQEQLAAKEAALENEYKNKLIEQQIQADTILKECQAISEFSIIQCELDKNSAVAELKETKDELKKTQSVFADLTEEFKHLKETYTALQTEICAKTEELEITKKELRNELDTYIKSLNQVSKEKAACEFTIKNSQLTIDVLKRRLIHSDRDVEQLKQELTEYENKLLDYEQKNIQLTSDLKQAQLANEEMEMQFESTIKMNCTDINKLGIQLYKEVNDYKKDVVKYKKKIDDEQNLKKEIMQQLHDAFEMINKLKIELDEADTMCSQYKFEMQQTQNELEDYHMREMDWNIIKDKLESTINSLDEIFEAKVHEVQNLKQELEQLREKYDSQYESSEYYRQKVQELQMELEDRENIHKKYIEMSGKHDVLSLKFEELEAENLQDKMKLMKLSEENLEKEELKAKLDKQLSLCQELEQKNKDLKMKLNEECKLKIDFKRVKSERDELLNKVQQLENELLLRKSDSDRKQTPKKSKSRKSDDGDLKKWIQMSKHRKEDKENLGSPNRTLNSPLRERN